jgi:uncharacterized membrane protein YheB (UPF0754 family)
MRKSTATNLIALMLVIGSFYAPSAYKNYLYYGGLFALSGAITNQIAIYMLFNKVPLLYGSGVIELNFEKFKSAIKNMIMEQFFTKERLNQFLQEEENKINLAPVIEETDFNIAFDALKESVMESKFGQLINMFGGEDSLEMLREKFTSKLKSSILSIVSSDTFKKQIDHHLKSSSLSEDLINKVDSIVDSRLKELGPKSVKELLDKLIREHLEWLVVWGGLFGGLIGLASTVINSSIN